MFKNSHLRLLMKLVGFERLVPTVDETPESAWIIPSHLTVDQIQDSLDLIKKAEFSPPTFEDGKLAEDQLRRKTAPRKKAVFDDDDDGIVDDDDDILFPAGGPTARKVADEFLDKPKKTRRRRRRGSDAEELSEELLEEKARARKEREKAKAHRFKSELFVHASDDESDDDGERWAEFYANEEKIRQRQKEAARGATGVTTSAAPKPVEKRKLQVLLSADSDNDDDLILPEESDNDEDSSRPKKSQGDDDEDSDAAGTDDTPLSSSPHVGSVSSAKRRRLSKEPAAPQEAPSVDVDMEDADDDEDIPASKPAPRARGRARAGFIVDSSDEE